MQPSQTKPPRPAHPVARTVPTYTALTYTVMTRAVLACAVLIAGACTPSAEGPATDSTTAPVTEDATASAPAPPWTRVPSDVDVTQTIRAGFLIVDGVYNSELMAPYDIFHHTPFHTEPNPGIEVFTVSPDGEPILTFEGLTITPHYSFDDAPPIDILVVPSAEHSMTTDLENETMIDWVRTVGTDARFLLSLCDGAFVLAEAGLLDGRAVTTFPGDQDRFAEMFPALDLRRNTTFVHDGQAITSEGGAKSYDPAMYLVDHIYGEQVAQGVGGGLIIDWPPGASDATVIPPSTP